MKEVIIIKYWNWSIEYNPCLYCPDRMCDCSTIEDDVQERCVICKEKKCKTPRCEKYYKAINNKLL